MIELLKSGQYNLIETKNRTKVLYLDDKIYALVDTSKAGEIIISSRRKHKTDCVLSQGLYRIFDVDDEPFLSDYQHLELQAGNDCWQGYLLLSGLPNPHKHLATIMPTHEVISGNPQVDCTEILQESLMVARD